MGRFIGVVVLLVMLPACMSNEAYRKLQSANDALRGQLVDLKGHQEGLEAENRRLEGEVSDLGQNVVDASYIEQQKAELQKLIDQFKAGSAGAIPGVEIHQTTEGVVFRVQGEILFPSGKAEISKMGESVLGQLLPALKEHEQVIRVDGHTDSDPIVRSKWKTNMRLSAERAMAVMDFLTGQGLPAERLFLSAFGPYRPAIAEEESSSKRQNRRVEILLMRG